MAAANTFRRVEHDVDFCVVGGGMAGLCAALSAARHGASVVLMQDRPVLGGNASGEIRVHISGADRHNSIKNMRETGILEELRLENLSRNPQRSFSVWDTILYEKAQYQPNLTLLLNCSCLDAQMAGDRIASVVGWQLTTQTHHAVKARIFADCSGDGVLAPLTGAEFRTGREARSEYDEPAAPEVADDLTMGMSLLFQTREHDAPQPFEPPAWAYRFDKCDDLPRGEGGHRFWEMGYWWVELGGRQDSIGDTEAIRDELLKIAYGVWDHIKNRCPNKDSADNWALEWMGFMPGKRESRRYVGEHVLTQGDIESEGRFDDIVAYGGWTMDDHHPEGFWAVKVGAPATIFHPAPSPFGIPYRSLCSKNVANLMFAGRCHSATHMAMSSTRVMGTCCSMGQAVGTAAALVGRLGVDPLSLGEHIDELQQTLLRDDAYLPWIAQRFSPATSAGELAATRGDPEVLRDGISRPVGDETHRWSCHAGDHVTLKFAKPSRIDQATIIFDSALDKLIQMSYLQKDDQLTAPPDTLVMAFRIDGLSADGEWTAIHQEKDNHQRLVRVPVGKRLEGIRIVIEETWGTEETNLYAFYVD